MPDLMDAFQEDQLRQQEIINAAARLPDNVVSTVAPLNRDCSVCEEPIEGARLRALPASELCIGCAVQVEKHLRRFARR